MAVPLIGYCIQFSLSTIVLRQKIVKDFVYEIKAGHGPWAMGYGRAKKRMNQRFNLTPKIKTHVPQSIFKIIA